jgi:hypothetical protein
LALTREQADRLALGALANPLIQTVRLFSAAEWAAPPRQTS